MPAPYLLLPAYDRVIRSLIANGELERALTDVALQAEAAKNEPLAFSRVYGSRTLDSLCQALGEAVASGVGDSAGGHADDSIQHAIYVCTETISVGGHARVISDVIRADPRKQPHVVFTNLWERPQLFVTEFQQLGAQITVLPKSSLLEKLVALLRLLSAAPRSRVYLFNHHQDAVAVAAVAGSPRHERYFVHHCDYQFCLGAFLPGLVHVDLHTTGYHRCREALGIDHNVYWPLTCRDSERRHDGMFMRGGGLTTCCCAAGHKFTGNYPIGYFDVVTEMLAAPVGRHVHIGPIDDPTKRALMLSLSRRCIAPERFVHIPQVPNLRDALLELAIDLYLVSFPLGGGRALIEAMSAGIPVIGHGHHRDKLLSAVDLLPEDAPVWFDVPELLSILATLDGDRLRAMSRSARRRFEEHHDARLLTECVAQGRLLAPPPQRCADVEPLQTVLFERNFVVEPPKDTKTFPELRYTMTFGPAPRQGR